MIAFLPKHLRHKIIRQVQLNKLVWIYFLGWLLFFLVFWFNTFSTNINGDIRVSHVNIWGDWAVHFTLGSFFAYNKIIPLSSPLLIGQPLSYPFVSDYLPAILVRLGTPLIPTFVFFSFFLSIFFVGVLFFFYRHWLQSKNMALIASLIFLLNGGIGFVYFGQDVLNSPTPLHTLVSPPRTYTRYEDQHLQWINVIDSMIIPQRSFLLGFPLSLVALGLIHSVVHSQKKFLHISRRQKLIRFGLAGLLIGLLPIVHSHSFLAMFVILACWNLGSLLSFTKKQRLQLSYWWLWLLVIVSMISLPLIKIYIFNNLHQENFTKFFPGWYTHEYQINWLWFWFKNWGLTPFLAILGLLVYLNEVKQKNRVWTFSKLVPFFIIFGLANLFLFQPYIWDNTKLIVWSSVAFSGLAAYSMVKLWQRNKLGQIGATAIFIFTILSGAIDAYRILPIHDQYYTMYTAEELQLSNWVKDNTPPSSIWLTNIQHNFWLFNLTGRQPIMTYPGWLWTHGYDYYPTYLDVKKMFLHPDQNRSLYAKYKIDYVIRSVYQTGDLPAAKKEVFDSTFTLIKESEHYQIYSASLQGN